MNKLFAYLSKTFSFNKAISKNKILDIQLSIFGNVPSFCVWANNAFTSRGSDITLTFGLWKLFFLNVVWYDRRRWDFENKTYVEDPSVSGK